MDSNAIRDPDLRTLGRAFDPSLTPLNCGGLAHFYVNLTKARIIWEEGNLIEGGEMTQLDQTLGKSVGHFLA